MKEALTDDILDQIYEAIGEGGRYEGIESMSVAGMTDKKARRNLRLSLQEQNMRLRHLLLQSPLQNR